MRRPGLLRLPLLHAALVCALVFLPGCPGECVGADCGDAYTASRLTLKRGRRDVLVDREQSALSGAISVIGGDDEGQQWATILDTGLLLIGVPYADAVHSLSSAARGELTLPDALGGRLTGAAGDDFGAALARAPTAGAADLWVGAPELLGPGTEAGAGGVYRFAGLGDGWTGEKTTNDAVLRVLSEHARDRLGDGLAACGDLDGDGAAELLIAAPRDDTSAALAGRVHIAFSANFASYQREILAGELDRSWTGDSEGALLGKAMRCADDLDGDGLAELLIAAPLSSAADRSGDGALFALSGAELPESARIDDAAAWSLRGSLAESYLGWSVATGEMDGDGYPELAIGAPGADGGAGQVLLIPGSALAAGDRSPRARVLGEQSSDRLGRSLAIADLDGDGFGDLAVGAPRSNPTGEESRFDAGTVLLFAGESGLAGWSSTRGAADADGIIAGDEQFLRAGESMVAADWDGDGRGDLLLLYAVQPP